MKSLFWGLAFCAGLISQTAVAERIAVAAWNVEAFNFGGNKPSAGSDPVNIALQLRDDFNQIGIFAFSELHRQASLEVMAVVAGSDEGRKYEYVFGTSGDSLRLGLMFDTDQYELVKSEELGFGLDPRGTRYPLAVTLRSKLTGKEFIVVANHFTRGKPANRQLQARELSAWAKAQDAPVIAAGDFNFDYDFDKRSGNKAFDQFMNAGVFHWQEPEVEIDTNWSDANGQDKYPNSYLDFVFAAGDAASWKSKSFVYRRYMDFPDSGETSDHRPVVSIFETESKRP